MPARKTLMRKGSVIVYVSEVDAGLYQVRQEMKYARTLHKEDCAEFATEKRVVERANGCIRKRNSEGRTIRYFRGRKNYDGYANGNAQRVVVTPKTVNDEKKINDKGQIVLSHEEFLKLKEMKLA